MKKMTLFWDPTGPLVQYDVEFGVLQIHDLNPEKNIAWYMTRWEMVRLGWMMIWAGLWYRGKK